eukprot:jgi/Psemu1/8740/gm1.8740_g
MNTSAFDDEGGLAIKSRRRPMNASVIRIALVFVLVLISATSRIDFADAFYPNFSTTTTATRLTITITRLRLRHQQHRTICPSTTASSSSTPTPTALGLFRPDWMRRAGRIEEKRKEYRAIHESLRNRQEQLGLVVVPGGEQPNTSPKFGSNGGRDEQSPRRYRVVSSCRGNNNNNNNSSSSEDGNGSGNDGDDDEDLLKIYLVVPENEAEASDRSNVLDCLKHGEVVTSIQQRTVSSGEPVRPAVVAASIIYNIDPATTMLKQRDVLWIEHDKGGWSPSIVDGVTRLVPIDDNEEENVE